MRKLEKQTLRLLRPVFVDVAAFHEVERERSLVANAYLFKQLYVAFGIILGEFNSSANNSLIDLTAVCADCRFCVVDLTIRFTDFEVERPVRIQMIPNRSLCFSDAVIAPLQELIIEVSNTSTICTVCYCCRF